MFIDSAFNRSLQGKHLREVELEGKTKKRVYKTESQHKFTLYRQKNAWMTKIIFRGTVQSFDNERQRRNKTGLLLLDNFSGHKIDEEHFRHTKFLFLMPNSTGYIQPNDQGLYQTIKERYRKYRRSYLVENRMGISQLPQQKDCIENLVDIAMTVSKSLVKTCYQIAGLIGQEPATGTAALVEDITELVGRLDVRAERDASHQWLNPDIVDDVIAVDDVAVVDDDVAVVDDDVILVDSEDDMVMLTEVVPSSADQNTVALSDIPVPKQPKKHCTTDFFAPKNRD